MRNIAQKLFHFMRKACSKVRNKIWREIAQILRKKCHSAKTLRQTLNSRAILINIKKRLRCNFPLISISLKISFLSSKEFVDGSAEFKGGSTE